MTDFILTKRANNAAEQGADNDPVKELGKRITRRHFLQSTIALATLPLSAPTSLYAAAVQLIERPCLGIYQAISDSRFAGSLAFGRHCERLGVRHEVTDGDVSRLWYETLQPKWREAPAVLVGMTTARTLLCLEQLARDHGMRVAVRIEHIPTTRLQLEHRASVPEGAKGRAVEMLSGRREWAQGAAQVVLECAALNKTAVYPSPGLHLPGTSHGNHQEALVSWLFAPVRQGRSA